MTDDLAGEAVVLVAFGIKGWRHVGYLSPEVGWVCEGASRWLVCHGRGRMVNNLTYMDPPALSRGFRVDKHA